jgi:hypothetical protein
MYQVPSDITTKITNVARAMTSPWAHKADRPYGLPAGGGGAAHALMVTRQAVAAAEATTPILLFNFI